MADQYTVGAYRPPAGQLAVDYDMPQELANCFIGRTPEETERRIALFTDWLGDVIGMFAERMKEEWHVRNAHNRNPENTGSGCNRADARIPAVPVESVPMALRPGMESTTAPAGMDAR